MDKQVNFKRAITPRNELELPRLYFITTDQWIEVIGETAFIAWLKFYSWCDRSEAAVVDGVNPWEQAKIPTSFNNLIERLHVAKKTFFNKIIAPLFEVGLIDVERYENSNSKGTKPLNVIVYKYPQNDITLASKPIVKVRDYKKDYQSPERTYAKQGGRPRNTELDPSTSQEIDDFFSQQGQNKQEEKTSSSVPDTSKDNSPQEGVSKGNPGKGGFDRKPGGVSKGNPGGFDRKPNNIFNLLNQSFNLLNQFLNQSNDDDEDNYNNTLSKITQMINVKTIPKNDFLKVLIHSDVPELSSIQSLIRFLLIEKIDTDYITTIVLYLLKAKRVLFTDEDMKEQLDLMFEKRITGNWPKYFTNGLIEKSKLYKAKEQKKIIEQRRIERQAMRESAATSMPSYDWLHQ